MAIHSRTVTKISITLIVATTFISGCSTGRLPDYPRTVATQVKPGLSVKQMVWRASQPFCGQPLGGFCLDDPQNVKKDTFVGVALSGGGSRSANFSIRVLQNLEAMGIMPTVTAISSTSGGSITAAYYAAFRSQENFWGESANALRQDFSSAAISHHFANPTTWGKLLTTTYNRTDSMVYAFDSLLLHGKTYGELKKPSANAPILYINATAITSPISSSNIFARGANSWRWGYDTFVFKQEATDDLGIDLSTMKLSQAVAASAAYPGLLETVSLRQHQSPEVASYLQLIDGGLSDNLAIKALIDSAISHSQRFQKGDKRYGGCLVILADAHVEDHADQRTFDGDLRERLSLSLLDRNLLDAFDALLIQRRNEQLLSIGIDLSDRKSGNYERIKEDVKIPLRKQSFRDYMSGTFYDSNDPNPTRTELTCTVWHISLNDAYTVPHVPQPVLFSGHLQEPWANQLQLFVDQVETNFKLQMSSPSVCKPDEIQNVLFTAADVLTLGDKHSRSKVCSWLASRGLVNKMHCELSPPLQPIVGHLNFTIDTNGKAGSYKKVVSCDRN